MSIQSPLEKPESLNTKSKTIITSLSTALVLACFGIAYLWIKKPVVLDQTFCPGACCDNVRFTGITEGSLDSMICNYRNLDWWKTSPLFSNSSTFSFEGWQALIAATPNATRYDGSYNSRYMDVDFESMENYLCRVKKNCSAQVKFIRFYYINYGNNPFTKRYTNKHSLAMIPLDINSEEIANAQECGSAVDRQSLIYLSQMANHNELCPPEPPIGCSKRLDSLDSDERTYQ